MSENLPYTQDVKVIRNEVTRLASSQVKTGRVIYQDDFNSFTAALSEKYIQSAGTAALDTSHPYMGKTCAKLTTGATAGNQAGMKRIFGVYNYLWATQPWRMGLEFHWMSTATLANLRYLYVKFILFDGTNRTEGFVRYEGTVTAAQQKWQYQDNTGAWVNFNTPGDIIDLAAADLCYNEFKLIIQHQAQQLCTLWSNDWMRAQFQPLNVVADVSAPGISFEILLETETNTAISAYISDIIVTDEEITDGSQLP